MLLKKSNLDPPLPNNYITFLKMYLANSSLKSEHHILDRFQSGFCIFQMRVHLCWPVLTCPILLPCPVMCLRDLSYTIHIVHAPFKWCYWQRHFLPLLCWWYPVLWLTTPDEIDELIMLNDCLMAAKNWKANNFLLLNADKTEVLIIGSHCIVFKVAQCIDSLSWWNLGVTYDQAVYFDKHIASLTRTCFSFHLRKNAKLRFTVSQPEPKLIVNYFISPWLD